jgi:ABC-type multidrug transport system ATPase subunit
MEGSITINGFERNLSQFRKLSCYIMQDNQLHGNLTVEEAMKVATSLKLGGDLSKCDKEEVVSAADSRFVVQKRRTSWLKMAAFFFFTDTRNSRNFGFTRSQENVNE